MHISDFPQHSRVEGVNKLEEISVLPLFFARLEFHDLLDFLILNVFPIFF